MINKSFQGLRTFCKTSTDSSLPFSVIGLPSDSASAHRSGARFGPSSIREASLNLTTVHSKFVTDITDYVNDLGDIDLSIGKPEKILEEIETSTTNVLTWQKHPVFLGGDHSTTLGVLRALNKKYGRFALISFDAHSDESVKDYDDIAEHGGWLFTALSENLIDATKTINIGARFVPSEIGRSYLLSFGGTVFTARYSLHNFDAIISNIIRIIGDTPVFLSIDMDVLDPAFAPGVGKPEIGGLSSMFVMECLENIWNLNWIGMDVVEVTPVYDTGGITSLAAATFTWLYLLMAISKKNLQDNQIEEN
jgi:agmatinase